MTDHHYKNFGPGLYVGVMTGTSLDAIDVAVVDCGPKHAELRYADAYPLTTTLQQNIRDLAQPGINELDRAHRTALALTHAYAQAVNATLASCGLSAEQIVAIGSHGQTIRHQPHVGYSVQLQQPAYLVEHTQIPVVADFRSRDLAAGGQGAPLVPAFHRLLYGSNDALRVVVNLGGMANITVLYPDGRVQGFDTGPGNTLLDVYSQMVCHQPYDVDGQLSRQGRIAPRVLERLLQHPYLTQPPPKSCGWEEFNYAWLNRQLQGHAYPANDVLATLTEFTAITVAEAINAIAHVSSVCLVGGGAFNTYLVDRLTHQLVSTPCYRSDALPAEYGAPSFSPAALEASAFAWYAFARCTGVAIALAEVTGATHDTIAGSVYL